VPNTSHGFYYPDAATNIAPLHTLLGNMQVSVDSFFDDNAVIHPIANVSGRAALVAEYPPTTSAPLFAWRADASSGQQLEVTTNGSTWTAIGANPAALLYSAQTLTDAQQAQSRTNISAASSITGAIDLVTDLDTFTSSGNFFQSDTPSSGLNYPDLVPGFLKVTSYNASYKTQEYTTLESIPRVFVRDYDLTAWTAWRQVTFTYTPPAALPFAKSTRNTQMTGISSSTWTRLNTLTPVTGSTSGIIDNTTGIITIPSTGLWCFSGAVTFATESTTRRMMAIEKGGGTPGTGTSLTRFDVTTSGYVSCSAYTEEFCTTGDQFSLMVYIGTSGSSLRGDFSTLWLAARQVQ